MRDILHKRQLSWISLAASTISPFPQAPRAWHVIILDLRSPNMVGPPPAPPDSHLQPLLQRDYLRFPPRLPTPVKRHMQPCCHCLSVCPLPPAVPAPRFLPRAAPIRPHLVLCDTVFIWRTQREKIRYWVAYHR